MADKKLRFEVEADATEAEKVLEEITEKAEALEEQFPTVEVKADTGTADADLKEVLDQLAKVDAETATPKVNVQVDSSALKRARADIKDVGDGAIQSVGPLRDVSAAFGNVGVGALDAAEGVLGFGESLATVNPKFQKFFEIASRSAFIGGAIAAGVLLATKALAGLTGATTKVADELDRVAASKGVEAFESFGKAIASSAIQNGLRRIGEGGKDIEKFNDLLRESPEAALNLINTLRRAGIDVTNLAGQYRQYVEDTAAASAQTKQFEADVAAVAAAQQLGIATSGKSIELINAQVAALERQNEARLKNRENTQGQASTQRDANDATEAGTDALDDYLSKLQELNQEIAGRSDAILSEAEARVALADAQARYNETVEEETATTDERVVAAQKVAEGFAKVAEAQAVANGESFTAEQRNAAIVASLKATAAQASGPTKAAIDAVVASLEEVPPSTNTNMIVNNAQALAKINEVIRQLQIAKDIAATAAFIGAGGNLRGAIVGVPTQSVSVPLQQNITVNAGFGTDAFAVRAAVLNSARQAARLAQNAVRFAPVRG
jgi:hypothetical protein